MMYLLGIMPLVYGFFLLFSFYKKNKRNRQETIQSELPMVSVLLAARNEESNISSCICSILDTAYSGKLEIWVGNDGSTDQTKLKVEEIIIKDSRVKLLEISNLPPLSSGKANVLAHLAHQAEGEVFVIIDADITVNPQFISEMVQSWKKGNALVNGVTDIKGVNFFTNLQRIDWVMAQFVMFLFHELQVPVSTIGNCMLISKKAYKATGGYEKIPFSITEDLALFKAVKNLGFSFQHLFYGEVTNISLPQESFSDLFMQRLRWMKGGLGLHLLPLLFLSLNLLYYPFMILGLWYFTPQAVVIFLTKMIFQISISSRAFFRINQKPPLAALILHEFYAAIHSIGLIVLYLLPLKTVWKGRAY
jgi:cellulose synthase/poly-beta-1,6-N-acetylglucosamine synthase-like glycosyltransferase